MPRLLGMFPIQAGIKPGFPDFPTSSSQPQWPSQPSPFLWFSAQPVGWREEGGEREGEGRGERGGTEGKRGRWGEEAGGCQCWAPSREARPGPVQEGPPCLVKIGSGHSPGPPNLAMEGPRER